MNLPLKIARRYLFAKKSTNAINIITGIAVFGLSVGSAALILVLSVFNGFEDLLVGMYSNFDPDVKISPATGKTFTVSDSLLKQVYEIKGVEQIAQTLEEVAFFEYKGSRDFGTIKGVDEHYSTVTRIDSMVREGELIFKGNGRQYAVLGVGMRNKLTVNVDNEFTPITVYMAKKKHSPTKPFIKRFLYPAGTFVIQQDFDKKDINGLMNTLLKDEKVMSVITERIKEMGNQVQWIFIFKIIFIGQDLM